MMPIAQAGHTQEQTLHMRWERRLMEGRFSPAVAGVRRLTIFGRSSSGPQAFPRLRAPLPGESYETLLDTLEPDERWAFGAAAQAVYTGREVFAVVPDQGVGEPLRSFLPDEARDILILRAAEQW